MQIGFNCQYCHASIFLDKEDMIVLKDEERISHNSKVDEINAIADIERKLQEQEIELIKCKLKNMFGSKCIIGSGLGAVYASMEKESGFIKLTDKQYKELTPKTKLRMLKYNGKPQAYFIYNWGGASIEEERYIPCPLCKEKNFLPLQSLIIK